MVIWLEVLTMNHEIMGSSLEFTNLFLFFLKKREEGGREEKRRKGKIGGDERSETSGGRGVTGG